MNAASTSEPTIVHLIGNAHIDPVWLWPVAEGRAEVLASYRTALALIREFEGYVFTSGGSVTYRWVEEDDPALFDQIVNAVHDGRWALVNGWWLQPDCNIPAGESFARHALYGQAYLESRFGQRARIGYNVDTFGHAGTLPQLLKLGGLDSYVFFRPGPQEMELPQGPFWWESPDGSRVLACRPPLHYGTPEETDMLQRASEAAAGAPEGLNTVLCFYGVGNHGGGPTRRNVQDIVDGQGARDDLVLRFSSPQAYFDEVRKTPQEFPTVRDELQHHARGCYSVLARIKQENRRAEHEAMRAERLATFARLLEDMPSAQGQIDEVWKGTLFNQFHDILAGTSIRRAYEDVWATYAQGHETLTDITSRALDALSSRLSVKDAPYTAAVWNTLPWPRREVVRLSLPVGGWRQDWRGLRVPREPSVTDAEGNPLPCQLAQVTFDDNLYIADVDVLVNAPALGATVVYPTVRTDPVDLEAAAPEPDPEANEIANERLRLRLDPDKGTLQSITDLTSGQEMLGGLSAVPVVLEDQSDTWSHGVIAYTDELGRFAPKGPIQLVERGPVRWTLRSKMQWGNSSLTMDVSLTAGDPAIDLAFTINWHEQHKMLKLAFVAPGSDHRITSSAPYGHLSRETTCEEEPTQAWVDISGTLPSGRQTGLCLVNDGIYGYDACGGELRLSLLRSPIYAFHQPREVVPGVRYHYIDQGTQTFRLRLIPHEGDWRQAGPDRAAMAWHDPMLPVAVPPQRSEASTLSLLEVSPDNVVATVAKLDDDGRLIVRGYETEGTSTAVTLASDALGCSWQWQVRPLKVWTVALGLEDGSVTRLNFLEEPLD
ncbi:MAG: alpha-mannosidase [Anaerolineae bacterium]